MSTILMIALGVALAPVIGFLLVVAVCFIGAVLMYVLAAVLSLLNGDSIKKALS